MSSAECVRYSFALLQKVEALNIVGLLDPLASHIVTADYPRAQHLALPGRELVNPLLQSFDFGDLGFVHGLVFSTRQCGGAAGRRK